MTGPWSVFGFFVGLVLLIAGILGLRYAGRGRPTCPRCYPTPMCATPRPRGCALFIADETGDE